MLITFVFVLYFSIYGNCQTDQLTENEFKYSLKNIWQSNKRNIARRKAIQICLSNPNNKYSLVNLYFLRKRIDKEKLRNALITISPDLASNEYAKSLKYYIDNNQLNKGDSYVDFKVQTALGQDFILSNMINSKKDILIVFGGLDCMGIETVHYFIKIYSKLNKEKVEIVNFLYSTDNEHLRQSVVKSGIPWPGVSDYMGDHSIIKMKYNAQGRPTFVYIKSNGKIQLIKEGYSYKSIRLLKKHIINK